MAYANSNTLYLTDYCIGTKAYREAEELKDDFTLGSFHDTFGIERKIWFKGIPHYCGTNVLQGGCNSMFLQA